MLRTFQEQDRAGIESIGGSVVGWWYERLPTIHYVAEDPVGEILAHLQVADLGGRRQGECSMILRVAERAWENDIPQRLLARAFAFCHERDARKITASYLSTEPDMQALLLTNGFEPFERYMPLMLDLATFNPEQFAGVNYVAEFLTYEEAVDTVENRRQLYDMEMAARATQPFREVGEYVPQGFDDWVSELGQTCHDTIFIASIHGRWVGQVRGLTWPFAGVRPRISGPRDCHRA